MDGGGPEIQDQKWEQYGSHIAVMLTQFRYQDHRSFPCDFPRIKWGRKITSLLQEDRNWNCPFSVIGDPIEELAAEQSDMNLFHDLYFSILIGCMSGIHTSGIKGTVVMEISHAVISKPRQLEYFYDICHIEVHGDYYSRRRLKIWA